MADLTQSPAPPDIRLVPSGPEPLIISPTVCVDYRAWPKDCSYQDKESMSSEGFSQEPHQGPDLPLECAACGQPRPAGTALYTQQNTQRTQRVCVFPPWVTLGGERKQERS